MRVADIFFYEGENFASM